MCGIAGIFAYNDNAPPVDRDELRAIRDRMASRGPDGKGDWYADNHRVGLGHRRLSVIDLSDRAAQPMASEDKQVIVCFNGEIYNYRELRRGLEAAGHRFRTESDTEVLIHLYRAHGTAMLDRLRGMFAFALWDGKSESLLLARDPFGIKPLYYSDDGRTIRLASTVRAMLASPMVGTNADPAGHAGFFLWGHVPDPFTLYTEIAALPAGHLLLVTRDGVSLKEYFNVSRFLAEANAATAIPHGHDPGRAQGNLRDVLLESLRAHLVADVPVGIFLSAGVDSGLLTALAVEIHPDIRTVTLGFTEYRDTPQDETVLAEALAVRYGTRHQAVWIGRDEFAEHADALLENMDQPTLDGANNYFVSLAARQAGLKVSLSGLGGDELFAGYPGFRQIPRLVHWVSRLGPLAALGGGMLRRLSAPLLGRVTSTKYAGLLEYGTDFAGAYLLRRGLYMPWELPALLGREQAGAGLRRLDSLARLRATEGRLETPHLKVSALELSWYMRHQLLRDADWAGMAHSLEIRVPFVDREVVGWMARHPHAHYAKAGLGSLPRKPLPKEITDRAKTGFTVPLRNWLVTSKQPMSAFQGQRGLRGWARYVYARKIGAALDASSRLPGLT